MTSLRLSISFALSLGVTVTLFWFLGAVTAMAPETGTWVPTVPVAIKRFIPEPIPKPPPVAVKPPKPEPKPVDHSGEIVGHKGLVPRMDPVPPGTGEGVFDPRGGIGTGEQVTGIPQVGRDRGPVPSVRIEPDYPQTARDRGIEGWVTFRFTVAVDGSVKDVAIVESQPPRVWDRATLRAVASWKYQPATKDGRAVEQRGMMATYRFELDR